jgi:hypothetical protein
MMASHNANRLRRNDESRNKAEHYAEPWSREELDFLLTWEGGEDDLAAMAELLGRTIEACRQRFYETRRGLRGVRVRITTTTTTTVESLYTEVCPECFLVHRPGVCDR